MLQPLHLYYENTFPHRAKIIMSEGLSYSTRIVQLSCEKLKSTIRNCHKAQALFSKYQNQFLIWAIYICAIKNQFTYINGICVGVVDVASANLNKKLKKKLVYQEFQHIGPEIISSTIFTMMADDHLGSRCPAVRLLWKWKLTSANWCLEIERWMKWMR